MRKVINKQVTEEDLIRTVDDRVRRRLAAGEALLHVRPAHRDRRGRAADRRARPRGHQGRPRGGRHARTSAARSRSAASCPSRTRRSSGPRSSTTRPPTRACTSCATRSAPTSSTARPSACATTTASRASSRDCCRAATAASGAVILQAWRDGARFDGWSEHFSYDRWMAAAEAALADQPVDVDWYTTRERQRTEVLPWDHLDSGPRHGVAVGGLAGRAGRGRGRRLPLDAVLRLRRLRPDGHRDPGRPDRGRQPAHARAAGAQPGARGRGRLTRGPPATRPRRRAHRPAAAPAVRQARPAAVLQPPRLPAGARARAAPGRGPDGLQRRVLPAPQGLLRELGAHGRGQRGRVRRDRRRRRPATPTRCATPSTRPCRPASTWSRWSRPARPDFANRLEASVWQVELPGVTPAQAAGCGRAAARRGRGPRRADDEERAPHVRRPRPGDPSRVRGGRPMPTPTVRYSPWSYGTEHRPYDPTTFSPRFVAWLTSCRRSPHG